MEDRRDSQVFEYASHQAPLKHSRCKLYHRYKRPDNNPNPGLKAYHAWPWALETANSEGARYLLGMRQLDLHTLLLEWENRLIWWQQFHLDRCRRQSLYGEHYPIVQPFNVQGQSWCARPFLSWDRLVALAFYEAPRFSRHLGTCNCSTLWGTCHEWCKVSVSSWRAQINTWGEIAGSLRLYGEEIRRNERGVVEDPLQQCLKDNQWLVWIQKASFD